MFNCPLSGLVVRVSFPLQWGHDIFWQSKLCLAWEAGHLVLAGENFVLWSWAFIKCSTVLDSSSLIDVLQFTVWLIMPSLLLIYYELYICLLMLRLLWFMDYLHATGSPVMWSFDENFLPWSVAHRFTAHVPYCWPLLYCAHRTSLFWAVSHTVGCWSTNFMRCLTNIAPFGFVSPMCNPHISTIIIYL